MFPDLQSVCRSFSGWFRLHFLLADDTEYTELPCSPTLPSFLWLVLASFLSHCRVHHGNIFLGLPFPIFGFVSRRLTKTTPSSLEPDSSDLMVYLSSFLWLVWARPLSDNAWYTESLFNGLPFFTIYMQPRCLPYCTLLRRDVGMF